MSSLVKQRRYIFVCWQNYIITLDYFSQFPEIAIIKDPEAKQVLMHTKFICTMYLS